MSTAGTLAAPIADTVVDGRYVILSVDGHAGATVEGYRDYLSSKYHEQFDEWALNFQNPFDDLRMQPRTATGTPSAGSRRRAATASLPRCCSRTPFRRSSPAGI